MGSFMQAIAVLFGHLDPRDQNARHDFCEMLVIAIAAVLCGAKNCSDMWRFAEEKELMLRHVLQLEHGIPSHDTFSALFRKLDPVAFAEAFGRFARQFAAAAGRTRHIALDGKAMRGAVETGKAYAPRMMVSAWGCEVRMTLACQPVQNGNETAAALEMLALLDLKGAVVTADALHCTNRMAEAVTARGGDYVLTLKGNQPTLFAAADRLARQTRTSAAPWTLTKEVAHGRKETRAARVMAVPKGAAGVHQFTSQFVGLAAIGEIKRERVIGGKKQSERWFYALSAVMSGADLLTLVRGHWDIENGSHWGLDVVFGEDDCRSRKDHGPENLSIIRRLCANTLRADSKPDTIRGKMMRASWSDQYLFQLMTQMR
jgi:predicted transposase YbfD/YdcC